MDVVISDGQNAVDGPHRRPSWTQPAPAAIRRLAVCLIDIQAWLKTSRLQLNPTKTQVMWLGSLQQLAKAVASARINVSETTRDLDVIVDSQLSLSAQMAAVCRSGRGGAGFFERVGQL